MSTMVAFEDVDIVFGETPEKVLGLLDEGASRAEIQERTGHVVGVHGCSLRVEQGEILVLMGLSGSGKSTLLRAVNGLCPVVRGAVRVHDGEGLVDVTQVDQKTLRRLRLRQASMVFQQFGLLPWRNVRDNVALGLELAGVEAGECHKRVQAQLELVGLSAWAEHPVEALSGGMQQRVGLARAFATGAPILLMDEPYSALDPLIRTRLQDELLSWQQSLGCTIIFVSHDLDEAFKLGSRIALMESGRLVQCGTPQEIFARPANKYVADFLAHSNPLAFLRAGDVMAPMVEGGERPALVIEASKPLRDALVVLGHHERVGVSRAGKLVGEIDARTLCRHLAGRGQASA